MADHNDTEHNDTDQNDTEQNDTAPTATEEAVGTEPDTGTAAAPFEPTIPEDEAVDPATEQIVDTSAAAVDRSGAGPEADQEPEPEPEPELPRFGARFSSPEPTAVVARPRRRATRPALSADPDSVEPPAPATPVPAFIAFVAPAADDAPPPRRRSRRPVESPVEEPTRNEGDAEATDDLDVEPPRSRRGRSRRRSAAAPVAVADDVEDVEDVDLVDDIDDVQDEPDDAEDRDEGTSSSSRRRRRGRRGRGRGRTGEDTTEGEDTDDADEEASADEDEDDVETADDAGDAEEDAESGSSTRRRRRRRRRGTSEERAEDSSDDDDRPERAGRGGRTSSDDDVRGVAGSTRLEAKRQRRRDGRDTGRRRAPILTESEFLARREAVDRKMVIRQRGERTQIAVLEDDILVEHYVTQASATSFAGNVYLGRVQNVLPSMEAAFVDIGKGRNAVLYAGEVNWDAAGLSGKQRSIEQALKSGDKVLVQVTKDPMGHKGARLTQQINLPGRFLVFVPGGSMTGISRKLPDTERTRLKDILKKIVPEDAGVIIRTAAEGASEEELTRDVNRLTAQWDVIQRKAESTSSAPTLLYGEPDLAIRVIRDVFNEDFKDLVVQGADAWDTVEAYVAHVSPELSGRLNRYTGEGDVFRDLRIDEQLAKALDRKVWLPSGGSLVIDRTEAMTVVDVNTGKFTGSGGNLEQTVTRNNIEAAEEIVRQLRLRDIGGMIVIDFIDMVLESNRDLVLRRLTECLARDRTKHQVAEVTSLGLVQMTRKRVGQGLLEVFSEPCEHCRGRGVVVQADPVDERRRQGSGNGSGNGPGGGPGGAPGSGNGGGAGAGGGNGRRDRSGPREVAAAGRDTAVEEQPAEELPGGDATADTADSPRSGGRRRGRRTRGQSGEERAAEDADVLAVSRAGAAPSEAAETDEIAVADDAAEAEDDAALAEAALANAALTGSLAAEDETAPAETTVADDSAPPAVRNAVEVVPVPEIQGTVDQGSTAPIPSGPAETGPAESPPTTVRAFEIGAVPADAPMTAPAAGDGAGGAGRPRRRRAASRPAGPPV